MTQSGTLSRRRRVLRLRARTMRVKLLFNPNHDAHTGQFASGGAVANVTVGARFGHYTIYSAAHQIDVHAEHGGTVHLDYTPTARGRSGAVALPGGRAAHDGRVSVHGAQEALDDLRTRGGVDPARPGERDSDQSPLVHLAVHMALHDAARYGGPATPEQQARIDATDARRAELEARFGRYSEGRADAATAALFAREPGLQRAVMRHLGGYEGEHLDAAAVARGIHHEARAGQPDNPWARGGKPAPTEDDHARAQRALGELHALSEWSLLSSGRASREGTIRLLRGESGGTHARTAARIESDDAGRRAAPWTTDGHTARAEFGGARIIAAHVPAEAVLLHHGMRASDASYQGEQEYTVGPGAIHDHAIHETTPEGDFNPAAVKLAEIAARLERLRILLGDVSGEPRDYHGRWTAGGGAGEGAASHPRVAAAAARIDAARAARHEATTERNHINDHYHETDDADYRLSRASARADDADRALGDAMREHVAARLDAGETGVRASAEAGARAAVQHADAVTAQNQALHHRVDELYFGMTPEAAALGQQERETAAHAAMRTAESHDAVAQEARAQADDATRYARMAKTEEGERLAQAATTVADHMRPHDHTQELIDQRVVDEASKAGIAPHALISQGDATARALVEGAHVFTAHPNEHLEGMLDSGELTSAHALNGRDDMKSIAHRRQEYDLSNYADATPNEQRPIYGYIAPDEHGMAGGESVSVYGGARIRLKDSANARTSVILGSAGDYFGSKLGRGGFSPLSNPRYYSLGVDRAARPTHEVADWSGPHGLRSDQYVEALVHGGVKVSDFHSVHFSADSPPSARLRAKLDAARIPYTVEGETRLAELAGRTARLREALLLGDVSGEPRDYHGRWTAGGAGDSGRADGGRGWTGALRRAVGATGEQHAEGRIKEAAKEVARATKAHSAAVDRQVDARLNVGSHELEIARARDREQPLSQLARSAWHTKDALDALPEHASPRQIERAMSRADKAQAETLDAWHAAAKDMEKATAGRDAAQAAHEAAKEVTAARQSELEQAQGKLHDAYVAQDEARGGPGIDVRYAERPTSYYDKAEYNGDSDMRDRRAIADATHANAIENSYRRVAGPAMDQAERAGYSSGDHHYDPDRTDWGENVANGGFAVDSPLHTSELASLVGARHGDMVTLHNGIDENSPANRGLDGYQHGIAPIESITRGQFHAVVESPDGVRRRVTFTPNESGDARRGRGTVEHTLLEPGKSSDAGIGKLDVTEAGLTSGARAAVAAANAELRARGWTIGGHEELAKLSEEESGIGQRLRRLREQVRAAHLATLREAVGQAHLATLRDAIEQARVKLLFNPNHDPSNGEFSSGGGIGGLASGTHSHRGDHNAAAGAAHGGGVHGRATAVATGGGSGSGAAAPAAARAKGAKKTADDVKRELDARKAQRAAAKSDLEAKVTAHANLIKSGTATQAKLATSLKKVETARAKLDKHDAAISKLEGQHAKLDAAEKAAAAKAADPLARAKAEASAAMKALSVAKVAANNAYNEHADASVEYRKALEAHLAAKEQAAKAIEDDRIAAKEKAGKAPATIASLRKAEAALPALEQAKKDADAALKAATDKWQAAKDAYTKDWSNTTGMSPTSWMQPPYGATARAQYPNTYPAYRDASRERQDAVAAQTKAELDLQREQYRESSLRAKALGVRGVATQAEIAAHPLVTGHAAVLKGAEDRLTVAQDAKAATDSALNAATTRHAQAQAAIVSARTAAKLAALGATLSKPLQTVVVGKWHGLNDVPIDVVERIQAMGGGHGSANYNNANYFHGINKADGELQLNALQKEVGFDGLPDVRPESDIKALVKAGETEAWRGDTNKNGDYSGQFMTGELHTGGGIYGHGTYIAYGAYGRDVAQEYARGTYNRSPNGKIMHMALATGARIIGYKKLEAQRATDANHWQQELAKAKSGSLEQRRAAANVWLCSTTSYYAVAHGWDGLDVHTGTRRGKPEVQLTWLNRTALRISDQLQ